MTLEFRLKEDLKIAMKSHNARESSLIRIMISGLKYKEIELKRKLENAESILVLIKIINEKKELLYYLKKAGRLTSIGEEEQDILFIEKYLPLKINEETIISVINNLSSSKKTFPEYMQGVSKILDTMDGYYDKKEVSELIARRISGKE